MSLRSLYAQVERSGIRQLNGVFDLDTVQSWLPQAGRRTRLELDEEPSTARFSYRTAIRSLAAIMPGTGIREVADNVHFILNNEHLDVDDVARILRGRGREVPFDRLRSIGALLEQGLSYRKVAEQVPCDRYTVSRIDGFLGVHRARRDRLIGLAMNQMEDGNTNRAAFARRNGLPVKGIEVYDVWQSAIKVREELKDDNG